MSQRYTEQAHRMRERRLMMAPATAMKNSTRAFRRSEQRRSWEKSFIHELVRSTTRPSARMRALAPR